MEIQNRETKAKYTMPKSSWDALGKNQAKFIVLNDKDEEEQKPQIIDNTAKPNTGTKVIVKDETNTKDKQTKKK